MADTQKVFQIYIYMKETVLFNIGNKYYFLNNFFVMLIRDE